MSEMDTLDMMFSETGIIFDESAPRTERLYDVLDASGNVIATRVPRYDMRGVAAFNDMFGDAGPYQYIESYTRLGNGRVLFSDENASESSHDASHVLSHVELHVHGARVYENILAADALALIDAWLENEWANALYAENLAYLADTLPVINDMLRVYPPMITAVIENILRPFPNVRSIIGNPFVVHYADAVNDAPAPTTDKPNVNKFGMRIVAKLPATAVKEYRYSGVPESVLVAHGYTLLDCATLRPIMSGTQQTIRQFYEDNPSFSPLTIAGGKVRASGNTLIVKYTNVWRYVGKMYRDGYVVYIRNARVFCGTKVDAAAFINHAMKNDKRITKNDVRAVRIVNNPLPVVAYTMR